MSRGRQQDAGRPRRREGDAPEYMFKIDSTSFWSGFAAAWGIVFVLWLLRRQISAARERLRDRWAWLRMKLTSGTERNWRADVQRFAQGAHVAGALFPLDNILIEPRFFKPRPPFDPTVAPPDDDLNSIIPTLADWPELAGIYAAPTIGLHQMLAGDGPLLILGGLGQGKTVALAQIASLSAQSDETLFPHNPTPLFVHAADVDLSALQSAGPKSNRPADLLAPLLAAAGQRASLITSANLVRHLRLRLSRARCLVLIDGFDELPHERIKLVAEWLKAFRRDFPQHRVIAAAGLLGYGPLAALGFAPVVVAPPGPDAAVELASRWTEQWHLYRAKSKKKTDLDIDPTIVLGWLRAGGHGRSVAELTLRAWAALAGDIPGPRPVDWLAAFVRRLNLKGNELMALRLMAQDALRRGDNAGLPRADAREIMRPLVTKSDGGKAEYEPGVLLDQLVARRVLVRVGRDRLGFAHGLLAAFFAAETLDDATEVPLDRHALWPAALNFFASRGDLSRLAADLLAQPGDALHTPLFMVAGWLRDSNARAVWRPEVFKRLSKILLDRHQPESLRMRAAAAFAASQDPSVARLFAQVLASQDPFARRLGALGLGALREANAVPQLAQALGDPYLDVRWASALALAVMGSDAAVETLRRALLEGDLSVKLAAAQALARSPEHGPLLLREALARPDHDTRRAAVIGIADLRAPWTREVLDHIRVHDQEWIVRNAAAEQHDQRYGPPHGGPMPYAPPEDHGWLVHWAAQRGQGVPPGRGAIELLNQALQDEDETIRIAAAECLAGLGDPLAARELYGVLRTPNDPLVRDAAFRALATISAMTGQRLAAAP